MDDIIYDERVGCVAVYEGPERNCLASYNDDDFLFYRHGVYAEGEGWEVSEEDIAAAKQFHTDILAAREQRDG